MSERPVHELIRELSMVLVQLSDKVLQNFFEAMHAIKHKDEQIARRIRMADDEMPFLHCSSR
jgi:phosphate transport system protein